MLDLSMKRVAPPRRGHEADQVSMQVSLLERLAAGIGPTLLRAASVLLLLTALVLAISVLIVLLGRKAFAPPLILARFLTLMRLLIAFVRLHVHSPI
jgi:hypothetical protein